jgi:hypothetical protein
VKVPLCTVGEAWLRILNGIIDGIWVDRKIGKHVFSTLQSNLHIFPHAITLHCVSISIIQAKQQAFSHC